MNTLTLLALLLTPQSCGIRVEPVTHCCNEGRDAKPWSLYNQGVQWAPSLAAAKKRAAREDKAVMLFQLVGDLDKEGC